MAAYRKQRTQKLPALQYVLPTLMILLDMEIIFCLTVIDT